MCVRHHPYPYPLVLTLAAVVPCIYCTLQAMSIHTCQLRPLPALCVAFRRLRNHSLWQGFNRYVRFLIKLQVTVCTARAYNRMAQARSAVHILPGMFAVLTCAVGFPC